MAERNITASAETGAVITQAVCALFTAIGFAFIDDIAAVVTGDTVPALQVDIRGVGVVGAEHLTNQNESIPNPSLFQCRLNGMFAFTFAEAFVLDMRMCGVPLADRILRLQGDDVVGLLIVELTKVQANLKRPQVNVVENDRICLSQDLFLLRFELDGHELIAQCTQFLVQQT